MAWKRPARREFLKGGAALASGLTLGAVTPAGAQGPASPAPASSSPPMHRDNNDEIRYGARSKYVTSVRIPHGNRPSPDTFGLKLQVTARFGALVTRAVRVQVAAAPRAPHPDPAPSETSTCPWREPAATQSGRTRKSKGRDRRRRTGIPLS